MGKPAAPRAPNAYRVSSATTCLTTCGGTIGEWRPYTYGPTQADQQLPDDYWERRRREEDESNVPLSMAVGAMTDSAMLGYAVGGSLIGGMLGDAMDGDL